MDSVTNTTKFTSVDLHQASYSPLSVKAIKELYHVKSGKHINNKTSFSKMVNFLRELED